MNRRWLLVLAVGLLLAAENPARAVPAFSGAEGFGAVTQGGAGGAVLHVTNLNDSGPGSLRAALEASGPRTVVFDVSGQIDLASEINVLNPYVTIAGETAPGDGITVAGETVSLDIHDVIVRYVRFRRGYNINDPDPRRDDALGSDRTNSNNLSDPKTGNIIIDHVSASWGLDENMSVYRSKLDTAIVPGGSTVLPSRNVTMQWSISSEALNPFRHAFGSTLGGAGVNHHHNLWASNTGRNPSLSFSQFIDFRNNVLFNWMHRSMDGAGPEAHVNVINNYYRPGPATGFSNDVTPQPIPELKVRVVEPEIRQGVFPGGVGWWYVDGNVVDGSVVGQDFSAVTNDNWEGLAEVAPGEFATGVQFEQAFPVDWARVTTSHSLVVPPDDTDDPFDDDGSGGLGVGNPLPISLPTIATQSANDAYASVLAGAGASLVRDAVDLRIIDSVATGVAMAGPAGNGIIDHPDDVGGYPVVSFVQRDSNCDTDGDGMPNHWEEQHGLDPNDAADRLDDFDADGYDNLQDYLNETGAFPAVQDIVWDDELANGRYAQIENWDIAFQPSRFDTARIHDGTVAVDAVGQHAGTLRIAPDAGDDATLDIASGWLKVADTLEIAAAGDNGEVNLSSGKLRVGTLAKGPNGSFNFSGGTLAADVVAFDLVNNGGTIAPGDSAGKTHVQGDLVLNGGVLEIELGGTDPNQFDVVTVDGTAGLAGTLDVLLIDGFLPRAGNYFEILSAGVDLVGTFTEILPALTGLLGWEVDYDYTGELVTLSVVTPFTADFDGDGDVDASDRGIWEAAYASTNLGDADGDGDSDGEDFLAWQQQYTGDLSTPLAVSQAVPEPGAFVLASIATMGLLFYLDRLRGR